ncbi:MAG TPA: hypothetical protein VLF63_03205 [Patescibacteria group bacterium]|nr:hypothetical protein [Patescibacteria group bacterium]
MVKNIKTKKIAKSALTLTILAAVLYNSWPLAFWLDPGTARRGLASDLEKVHHPYFWLFILLDILTSLIILIVIYLLRVKLSGIVHSKMLKYVMIGLGIFSVFTITASLLPSDCSITPILKCRVIHQSGLGIDALTSTLAALGLFLSLIAIRNLSLHHKLSKKLHLFTQLIFVLWIISGLLFIYFTFSKISTIAVEDILLILSGAIIVLIGVNINEIVKIELRNTKKVLN